MFAPKSGAGALIYYQGYSEPETAKFVMDFLKPGMTFWDVGAHIGEYSLLASRHVGSSGRVFALEPRPDVYEFLKRNVAVNGLGNVTMRCLAVNDRSGVAQLSLHSEPSMSFLSPRQLDNSAMSSIPVNTVNLDGLRSFPGDIPHLIKVDVEGAEREVLAGSNSLLRLPARTAPAWIMEFDEDNCSRFGYDAQDLLAVFSNHGFETYWIARDGLEEVSSSTESGAHNIFAVKRARAC